MHTNPYRFFGRPATGGDFVERAALTRRITGVWQEPGRPGNLSVIGYSRSGKTSLVLHALSLMDRTDLAVVRVDVAHQTSALGFFRAVAEELAERLPGIPELGPAMNSVHAAQEWYDLDNAVSALFKEVARHGRHVLLVVEEFDRAPLVLAHLSAFQLLRSLASEPDYPVGLITVSRRPIIDIETDAAGGSRLDGVMGERCHVGMLTPEEAGHLVGRARPTVDLSGVAAEIIHRAGRHPFLIEALCYKVVGRFVDTGVIDVAGAYETARATFESYFERLIHDIDTDTYGRGRAVLLGIAAGASRTDPVDVQKLTTMGVVEPDGRLFTEELVHHLHAAPATAERCVALVVATEWSSQHGGLSTLNRQLCLGLADRKVRVFCMVLDATDQEVAEAEKAGVVLLRRAPVAGAPELSGLLRRPELPDGVTPTLVIGHGRVTGPAALILAEDHFPAATKLHFVHMAPDEIEFHKLDRTDDLAESAETRTRIELSLGRSADRLVAVGPRLHGRYLGYLSGHDDREPLRFDPGFDLTEKRPRRVPAGTPLTVLITGRMEDSWLKGLDIALRACGTVADWRREEGLHEIELVIRGMAKGAGGSLMDELARQARSTNLLIVPRNYSAESGRLTEDLQRSSLFLMPSRAEGFGLAGLEAIVAGTPALISEKSGLGQLLIDLFGRESAAQWVVPMHGEPQSDADTWARAIDRALRGRKAAFTRAEHLRQDLAQRLTWAKAADALLDEVGL